MNALTIIPAIAPLRVANDVNFTVLRYETRVSRPPRTPRVVRSRAPLVARWISAPDTGEILRRWEYDDAPGECG